MTKINFVDYLTEKKSRDLSEQVIHHFPKFQQEIINFSEKKSRTTLPSSDRPGLPSSDTRPSGRPTSRANQGRNKKISPPVDADSQVRPRRRTASAGPDAISTGPRYCRALHTHRTPSSSSPG